MNYEKHSNRKKQENIHSVSKKTTKKIGITFIKIFVFTCLLVMIVGLASGLGIAKAIIDKAPDLIIDDVVPEGFATIIYDQNGNEIQQLHGEEANRIYADLDQIPKYLQDAIVSIEDERFWQHNGIDMQGIFRAIFKNIKERDLTASGASTLTQQVIKNNVLSTEKKFERKIQEQYLAIQLEKQMNKEKILELYLNTSPFGRGTLGVQTAANTYFRKDVSELTIAESAVIASITQLPTYYDPVIHPENNRKRQVIVLQKMFEQEYITKEEYDQAYAEDVYAHIQLASNDMEAQSDYSYFVDEVIRSVREDLKVKKGYTDTQAINLIYRGGLSIYMTQDLKMQQIMDNVFNNEENFPPQNEAYAVKVMYTLSVQTDEGIVNHYEEAEFDTNEEGQAYIDDLKSQWILEGQELIAEKSLFIPQPQAAMVIMDYHTGHMKAVTGGRGQKIGNQTFNRATQAERQPGSTFKILAAYLPAIDTGGYTLGTAIDDVPFQVTSPNGSSYTPGNWYRNQAFNFRGLTSVRIAIRDSMNICAVKTLADIGPNTAFDYLMNLGFTTLIDREEINGSIYSDKTLAIALGGVTRGVTSLELNAAYGAFANKGVYVKPLFYTRVLSHDRSILLNNELESKTVMKETTAFLLTSAMQSVINAGTGGLANFKEVKMPIAGKTGTTNDDVDLLFSGYTPYYVGTVWMGYDQPKKMVYSKSYHLVLWQKVMEKIHADLPFKEFEVPSGIVSASICSESGKLFVSGLCDHDPRGSTITKEYFAAGTVPTESCDVHVKATICSESNLFATEFCPETSKMEKIFIVRPVPLIPENWDPANPPRIADFQYELPASMVGEYCNIHTSTFTVPVVELPGIPNSNGSKPGNGNGNGNGNSIPPEPTNPLDTLSN